MAGLLSAGRRVVEDAAADAAEVDDPVWLHDERARSPGVQARNRDLPPAHTVVVTAVHAKLPRIIEIIISGVDAALSRWIGGDDVGALGRGPAGRSRPCLALVGRDVDPATGVCFDRPEQPLVVVRVDGERVSFRPRAPQARCPRRTT